MKKSILCVMTTLMLLSIIPTPLKAVVESNPVTIVATKTDDPVDPNTLLARIYEIKAIDKSTLSKTEKKELRKELRQTKKQLKEAGHGGVYLSVGSAIIIILLLIILL